mmetsp:Transcript_12527/g.26998  ORF Transcript_12527/g.26998 Transcript_12527/m.26998 type:complete len:268 (+) Transcript_12527:1316-2119(+)
MNPVLAVNMHQEERQKGNGDGWDCADYQVFRIHDRLVHQHQERDEAARLQCDGFEEEAGGVQQRHGRTRPPHRGQGRQEQGYQSSDYRRFDISVSNIEHRQSKGKDVRHRVPEHDPDRRRCRPEKGAEPEPGQSDDLGVRRVREQSRCQDGARRAEERHQEQGPAREGVPERATLPALDVAFLPRRFSQTRAGEKDGGSPSEEGGVVPPLGSRVDEEPRAEDYSEEEDKGDADAGLAGEVVSERGLLRGGDGRRHCCRCRGHRFASL